MKIKFLICTILYLGFLFTGCTQAGTNENGGSTPILKDKRLLIAVDAYLDGEEMVRTPWVAGIGTVTSEEIVIPAEITIDHTDIIVPVYGIWENAFKGCTFIKKITIPESIVEIGKGAFDGCVNLKAIDFEGTEEQWHEIVKGEGWNNLVPEDVQIVFGK